MTRREIATLACKILALWMFAQTALLFGSVIVVMVISLFGLVFRVDGLDWQTLFAAVVLAGPAIATLIVSLFLWRKAPSLANRMVSDDPTPVTRDALDSHMLMMIASVAVGLFLLVPSLRNLAGSVFEVLASPFSFADWWETPHWRADFISSLVGLILSAYLILGSAGIARAVHRLRNAGTIHHPDEHPPKSESRP
ncbi:MAG: hypothetical protein WD768_06375 [Phycisphaeraceae bacterium]